MPLKRVMNINIHCSTTGNSTLVKHCYHTFHLRHSTNTNLRSNYTQCTCQLPLCQNLYLEVLWISCYQTIYHTDLNLKLIFPPFNILCAKASTYIFTLRRTMNINPLGTLVIKIVQWGVVHWWNIYRYKWQFRLIKAPYTTLAIDNLYSCQGIHVFMHL